jgi:hypothetical protein
MNKIDFNSLAQALDSTWGRSSTPKTSSFSVKMSIVSDASLKAVYNTIINFASEREMIVTKRRVQEEARAVIKAYIDHAKKSYKELTGNSLKTVELSFDDTLEVAGHGAPNAVRTMIYRCVILFEIA